MEIKFRPYNSQLHNYAIRSPKTKETTNLE